MNELQYYAQFNGDFPLVKWKAYLGTKVGKLCDTQQEAEKERIEMVDAYITDPTKALSSMPFSYFICVMVDAIGNEIECP